MRDMTQLSWSSQEHFEIDDTAMPFLDEPFWLNTVTDYKKQPCSNQTGMCRLGHVHIQSSTVNDEAASYSWTGRKPCAAIGTRRYCRFGMDPSLANRTIERYVNVHKNHLLSPLYEDSRGGSRHNCVNFRVNAEYPRYVDTSDTLSTPKTLRHAGFCV